MTLLSFINLLAGIEQLICITAENITSFSRYQNYGNKLEKDKYVQQA